MSDLGRVARHLAHFGIGVEHIHADGRIAYTVDDATGGNPIDTKVATG
jgi:hypothetical protein